MTNKILTLNEILDNSPRELDVKGIGIIKVRDPTTKDRIDAKEEAKKDSRWEELSIPEQDALVLDFMALRMIVEPKITIEDYYKANSVTLMNIVNAVIIDYTNRYTILQDKRKKEINDFLDRMKDSKLGSSTTS